jgi:two-component system heavy metal sensor histidine kinase CusS
VRPHNSISLRLALMFSVAALAGFLLIGFALNEVLARELVRQQREQVMDRLEDLRYLLVRGRADDLASRARDKIEALSGNRRVRYWLWSADAKWVYGDGAERMAMLTRGQSKVLQLPAAGSDSAMAVLGVNLSATPARPAVSLIVGVNSDPFIATLHGFRRLLVPIILGGAVLLAALGYWISRLGLRPVLRLSTQAQRIGPNARDQRLDSHKLPLELSDLGESFNAALDRLAAAYAQLESFNADVAHELRTPLANLIGQTQVALSRERGADELQELLQSNLEELERLRAIVADMLFLARAEQGARAARRVPSSLAAEVGKTVEFYEMLLDDAGLTVRIDGDAQAVIETSLFHRAMSNLLQNAIQHAPQGSVVTVRVRPLGQGAVGGGGAEVTVSNPGPGIPPDRIARIFDRFYRADAARANSDANHGLGLAIVKAVALMHGGEVMARSEQGEVTVGFSVASTIAE